MRNPVLHSLQLVMLSMRCPVPSCPQLTLPLKVRLKLQNITLLQSLRDLSGTTEGQRLQVCYQVHCRRHTQRSMGNTLKRPGSTTCCICSTLTAILRLMEEHALRSSMPRRQPAKQARVRLARVSKCEAGQRGTTFFEQVLSWRYPETLS